MNDDNKKRIDQLKKRIDEFEQKQKLMVEVVEELVLRGLIKEEFSLGLKELMNN